MQPIVYFDNSATTQPYPRVLEAMQHYLYISYGNPAAKYHFSIPVRKAITHARQQIADTLGVNANEVFFTSGGTESDNWALYGVCRALACKGKHIITSKVEHKAILESCASLAQHYGYEVTYLEPQEDGSISPESLRAALRKDTILVSLMAANNEVGTISDIRTLSKITHENGTCFHTDAVQAYGYISLAEQMEYVDLLSASAHKFHGPKGIGFLYVRQGTALEPLIYGGGQELGMRSGTENVAAIVGIGCAAEMVYANIADRNDKMRKLRTYITERILSEIPNVYLTGSAENRLPHHASFCFGDISGLLLVDQLSRANVCVSSGSACSNNQTIHTSYVLKAMGLPEQIANGALRISCSENNTFAEADLLVDCLKQKTFELRQWM